MVREESPSAALGLIEIMKSNGDNSDGHKKNYVYIIIIWNYLGASVNYQLLLIH